MIITISILVAAGLAVYENPQVREWLDTSRRKIAVALHNLGDDISPPRSPSTPDPSTRPDESPEAAERRRRAREEILERGRALEEKKRRESGGVTRASFDSLVNEDGNLKEVGLTTAIDEKPEEEGLRNRSNGIRSLETENPFTEVDESHLSHKTDLVKTENSERTPAPAQTSRESTATLPTNQAPPNPIDTETISHHPSEQLVDLTPTTSSSDHNLSSQEPHTQPSNYWSVNEWAETTSTSFYSDISGDGAQHRNESGFALPRNLGPPSLADSGEEVGAESSVDGDLDVMSDFAGISTPGTWTEVGSVVSDGDHGQ